MLFPFALAAALQAQAAWPAVSNQEITVELRRGKEASGKVQAWFSAFDRVLQDFEEASRLLAREAEHSTVAVERRALALSREMAQAYRQITEDDSALSSVEKLGKELERLTHGLSESDALPKEAFEAIYSLGQGRLYRWIHLLKQGVLEAPGPRGLIPVNALVTVHSGDQSVEVPVLDLSQRPLLDKGRIVSPALRALVLVINESPKTMGISAVLSGRRFWLRHMDADFFADLTATQAGGMIYVRYREQGLSTEKKARFYFFTKVLYEAGFAVRVEGGELDASLGAGRLRMDSHELADQLIMAFKAFAVAADLPAALKAYLADSPSSRENEARLDYLARIFLAEGYLPFVKGPPDSLRNGVNEYREKEPEREAERIRMNKILASLGLGAFPPNVGVGRRTIRLYYEQVLEAAEARGEVKRSGQGAQKSKDYDPLFRLASLKSMPPQEAVLLTRLCSEFRTIGLVGSSLAQRAQWRLGSEDWLTVYAVRAPEDGHVESAMAERGVGSSRQVIDIRDALAQLKDLGLLSESGNLVSISAQKQRMREFRPETTLWALTEYGRSAPETTSKITYDRSKALMGESIYVTPYVTPEDRPALKRCRALVTTSGGPLAAILAAEAGVPALELGQAQWSEASGLQVELPMFSPPRPTPFGTFVRGVAKTRWVTLREGEAIGLDPARQQVEFLDADRQAVLVRLEEALKAYDRGADINALALWVVAQMRASGFSPAQKHLLASQLRTEMEKRRKTGIPAAHRERIRAVLKENF